MVTTCPTCGSPVQVVSSGEGTNHYGPAAAPAHGMASLDAVRESGYTPAVDDFGNQYLAPIAAAPAEGESASAGNRSGLREAATDVLHAWDAGDIDHDYDRIASAFDSLRAALARHESGSE